MPNWTFDEKDAEILKVRKATYDKIPGPRVGDFLKSGNDFLRFTHDWGDDIQTTLKVRRSGNFYLGKGYCSFSGSLDSAIPKSKLRDTGEKEMGEFWFFHHDLWGAGRDVYFQMECRVFETIQPEQED